MRPQLSPTPVMTAMRLVGNFVHVIFSPHGTVEGFLLRSEDGEVQLVLDKDDEKNAAAVASLQAGQRVAVSAEDPPPSPKAPGVHAVHALRKLVSVDGAKPPAPAASAAGYGGTIVRLNYARHGAPNGFVLDSGDFIHVRPDGFAKLRLQVGDRVTAEGDARLLATGDGWAVEADSVKRQTVEQVAVVAASTGLGRAGRRR